MSSVRLIVSAMLYLTIHLHPILHTTQLDFPGLYLCEALPIPVHTHQTSRKIATLQQTPVAMRHHADIQLVTSPHPHHTADPVAFKCVLHQLFKL